jgi:hypothetical protein
MHDGDPERARSLMRDALLRQRGDCHAAAWDLFMSRKQFYRYVLRLGMYPVIDRIRARADTPPWARVVEALNRGEKMSAWEKVIEGVKGKTVEEVSAMLSASKYVNRIEDVDAFAEALVQAANDGA